MILLNKIEVDVVGAGCMCAYNSPQVPRFIPINQQSSLIQKLAAAHAQQDFRLAFIAPTRIIYTKSQCRQFCCVESDYNFWIWNSEKSGDC